MLAKFVKVMPRDYKRGLQCLKKVLESGINQFSLYCMEGWVVQLHSLMKEFGFVDFNKTAAVVILRRYNLLEFLD
jgi:hypothetical protein